MELAEKLAQRRSSFVCAESYNGIIDRVAETGTLGALAGRALVGGHARQAECDVVSGKLEIDVVGVIVERRIKEGEIGGDFIKAAVHPIIGGQDRVRSEERRVGKEGVSKCRSRW